MLHFLENQDEQRIASPEFAGKAEKAKPAMVVSTLISTAPTMIYFGQEVGEPGAEDAGFGTNSRTTIFDYFGVPHHQRWMNGGAFDGGRLRADEKALRTFYKDLLNFSITSEALMGEYKEIHSYNREKTENYNTKVFSFARWTNNEQLIVISNFDDKESFGFDLKLPEELIKAWQLKPGTYTLLDGLSDDEIDMSVSDGVGVIELKIKPLDSYVLRLK